MKKSLTVPMLLLLLLLSGCAGEGAENSETRFVLDTVATVTAPCDDETLDGAFVLCEELERLLSRTVPGSDVSRLNETDGFVTVSRDTARILERAVYYADLSGGKFDITICPVSSLWDFKNQVIPDRSEIAAALRNVDYHSIEQNDTQVNLHGKQIDLGAVAKGYIADKMLDYFAEKGVKSALVNLGGNVAVRGSFTVGIQKPFSDSVLYRVKLQNKSAVTAGIYERYIESDGHIYHHILDPETGYGVENELASVTVIGDSSLDCDELSTTCMLVGGKRALAIINDTPNTEAVLINRDGTVRLSDGIYIKNDKIVLNEGQK